MEDGYRIVESFLDETELEKLDDVLFRFHNKWIQNNKESYEENAINSAYITSKKTIANEDRKVLFDLISSPLIKEQLSSIFPGDPCFLNTQLFFDPVNKDQSNYWHRDIQYTGLSIEEQKVSITENVNNVVHFRIALRDELGIELVPKTNHRWDTDLEYEVRNGLNNRNTYDDLLESKVIKLSRGDLLIFSANMIHRGLYGRNRFAFDILYCEPEPSILKYADIHCYPDQKELLYIDDKQFFTKLYEITSQRKDSK